MNLLPRSRFAFPILGTFAALFFPTLEVRAADATEVGRYNVVWDSPSADAHGSMPIGNGDVGVNAWVEPSGDLVFYVSKTDAWDENGRLCKIGRVRVTFDPPLATNGFRQELKLREGVIEIQSAIHNQQSKILLWADANRPVVHVEAESESPVRCRAAVELWRLRERPFGAEDDSHSGKGLSRTNSPLVVLPDVVVTSAAPRVVWYHRNTQSIFPLCLQLQHLESLKDRIADPLLNGMFGASLSGGDFVADGALAIKSRSPAKRHVLSVAVHAAKTETPGAWLRQLERVETQAATTGLSKARAEHEAWWRGFWDRSWVFVDEKTGAAIPPNAHPVMLGSDPNGGNRFRGEIAAPAIHGRALAAPELLERKPPDAPAATAKEFAGATNAWPDGLTIEAWIRPAPGENGRIFDKSTPTKGDGFLLDTHPGLSLRLIVGPEILIAPKCLQAGAWQHVAATFDSKSGARTIYLNGQAIARGGDEESAPSRLTRGYVLQRFMNACSGRGGSPIKFNGSIFTVEAKPGTSPETPAGDPDWRLWGGNYWFQNTRLAYWPMLAAGDFDLMEAWFRMYRDALPLGLARVQTYYGFDRAAVFPETMYSWGLPNNGDYGWNNAAPEPANGYIKRYWNGSLELTAVMLDRYDFTQDEKFARDTLVPLADPLVAFLDQYWKRDAGGKIRFDPSQSLETWHVAVNPMPEIAGLRFLLPRLLALPQGAATEAQRARWTRLLGELPPVPVADVQGTRLLRPAESFSHRSNSENPELYAVFPYRLYGVGRPDLEMARASYAARANRHNRGWCQDSIQAACLGLGDEAGRLVSARAAQVNTAYRFPVMWGPNFDWIPDQDHGNNILTTLQFMLLQSDGGRIFVLPAWPKDWNVSFKLHAPKNTTVECVYRDGRIEALTVTPPARRKDVLPAPGAPTAAAAGTE